MANNNKQQLCKHGRPNYDCIRCVQALGPAINLNDLIQKVPKNNVDETKEYVLLNDYKKLADAFAEQTATVKKLHELIAGVTPFMEEVEKARDRYAMALSHVLAHGLFPDKQKIKDELHKILDTKPGQQEIVDGEGP